MKRYGRTRAALAALSAVALCTALAVPSVPSVPPASAVPPPPGTGTGSAPEPPGCRRTLVGVAHPDDDLFFINPEIMRTVRAGCFVSTVYLTAGDGGEEVPHEAKNYAMNRENGIRKAYAEMAGAPGLWQRDDVRAGGRLVRSFRLFGGGNRPDLRLTFLDLHDGKPRGQEPESLLRLFEGTKRSITPLRGRPAYTEKQLLSVLAALTRGARAERILTLDPDSASFTTGVDGRVDHSDHGITARYFRETAYRTGLPSAFYLGYTVFPLPGNLSPAQAAGKEAVVRWYMAHSRCPRESVCTVSGPYAGVLSHPYRRWVDRQYRRTHRKPGPGEILGTIGRVTESGGPHPEQCLGADAQEGPPKPATVAILPCDGSAGQKWQVRADGSIRSLLKGDRCLAAVAGRAVLRPCRPSEAEQKWKPVAWHGADRRTPSWKLMGAGNACLYQNDRSFARWNRNGQPSPRLDLVNCDRPVQPELLWNWT
ncbi:PIG-L family deacetylase [Streptomyces sp. NPDC051567]|uniref:PIG-L family deacetylase n=1 Tax=Streptomyces sp. NPDC051567 TaxID=3365660 RepID=UPI0037883367